MNVSAIEARVDSLLAMTQQQSSMLLQNTLYQGTLGVMHALYGPNSSQERDLRTYIEKLSEKLHPSYPHIISQSIAAIAGALASVKGELQSGFVGSLRAGIAGELLSDLLKLARTVLDPLRREEADGLLRGRRQGIVGGTGFIGKEALFQTRRVDRHREEAQLVVMHNDAVRRSV